MGVWRDLRFLVPYLSSCPKAKLFIGEEIGSSRGQSYLQVLSVALADQRIQTCLEVLEKLGSHSHHLCVCGLSEPPFPICVTDMIPTLWCCSEDVKHLR